MRSIKFIGVLALAVFIAAIATTVVAAPLTAGTQLHITQGTGSATNTPCSSGSCFGMEVSPGFVIWTDFGSGTDGGIVVGKSQLSGGQEASSGAVGTDGELSAIWSFFSSNGTFYTSPNGDTHNIYDDAPCAGAPCIGVTTLGVFNVAWNGNIIPMGSDSGCTLSSCSANQLAGIFVNDWQIDTTAGTWSMNYAQVVPSGGFQNVKFSAIMRGTVVPVPPPGNLCTGVVCNDNNACTTDACNVATGLCVFTDNSAACNDNDDCTTDSCDSATGCVNTVLDRCSLTAPILVKPSDGQTGVGTTVEFRWTNSTNANNDPVTYKIVYCTASDFTGCTPVTVAHQNSKNVFYAGGAGLLMIGMTFFGGLNGRKRIVLLFAILVLFAGGTLISCGKNDDTELPANQTNYVASGLSTGTTYYWKVTAVNGTSGRTTDSAVQSFTTE